jgi:hypothetical protein
LGAIRADAETAAARKGDDHDRAARHEYLTIFNCEGYQAWSYRARCAMPEA